MTDDRAPERTSGTDVSEPSPDGMSGAPYNGMGDGWDGECGDCADRRVRDDEPTRWGGRCAHCGELGTEKDPCAEFVIEPVRDSDDKAWPTKQLHGECAPEVPHAVLA